ncbi:hypothetical protein [Acinetobacter nectaris]|uniref:hypothetical protein n=1 Tax=Acinetobacter nectaris TaxID=1219382 RepID=UPI001F3701FE|nr:hypothetical protein [Acinetobacter nectaris]MCF9047487.1 hypothetical protein [Acinetobacter nectaris]
MKTSKVTDSQIMLIAKNIFIGQDTTSAIQNAKETIQRIYPQESNLTALNELEKNVFSYDLNDCRSSGYVVDLLMTSLLCLDEDSYSKVIKKLFLWIMIRTLQLTLQVVFLEYSRLLS